MHFKSITDFEAPLDRAFEAFSDFDGFERQGKRMGAVVDRVDDLTRAGCGMMWRIKADYRGKPRKIDLELVDFQPSSFLEIKAISAGFDGGFQVELVSLSPSRTRATVEFNINPTSLSARLVLQSARLAKSSLTNRFRSRVNSFCDTIEDDFRTSRMA